MTDFGYAIVVVRGDNLGVKRTVTAIPTGSKLATAWFTVKVNATDPYANAVIKKKITVAATADGQITDDGSGTGTPGGLSFPVLTGQVLFKLLPADTRALTTLGPNAYLYDVQVKMDTGELYTLEEGSVTVRQEITEQDS